MSTEHEFKQAFFKALKSDRTVMLGIDGIDSGHTRPMTAQFEEESGPIWFFSGNDNVLVQQLHAHHTAIFAFSAKDHSLFASVKGTLRIDNNRAVIDRLWNPFVAAWYTGKDDPNLALLRMDATSVEVWQSEHSLLTGIKAMLGMDVKEDMSGNVAQIALP